MVRSQHSLNSRQLQEVCLLYDPDVKIQILNSNKGNFFEDYTFIIDMKKYWKWDCD